MPQALEAKPMTLTVHLDPAPLRVDANGDVRVGDTRVLLDLVVRAFEEGAMPETIVARYSTLGLADVYGVLAYYLHHREEVGEYLRWREERAREVRRKIEAQQGDLGDIRARLLARQVRQEANHAVPGE